MKILLVEPETSGKIIPVGLLKIAAYAIKQGHTVYLARLNEGYPSIGHFDKAYVTSLYTWEWREVWKAVSWAKQQSDDVYLGGIYASLLPEHAEQSGAKVIKGTIQELDLIRPAYELIPDCDYSVLYISRGCIRKCEFCAVPKIEGKLKEYDISIIRKLIHPKHHKIIFLDNNILAHKKWDEIYLELRRLNKSYDFLQGLDSRLINEKVAEQLSKLKLRADQYISVRLALDDIRQKKHAERAAELLKSYGIHPRRIMFYCLYNFKDTPEDFFERVRTILSLGCVAFPMRYQSIELPYALEKDSYIGKHWSKRELEIVEEFIWKYGKSGAIPPYVADHFNRAKDFYEAFSHNLNISRLQIPA